MSAADDVVLEAADRLFAARRTCTPIEPLAAELGIAGPDRAYAVQDLNTKRWLAEGRRPTGRKIGLTSTAVQAQLGVDQPDYGMLYRDMEYLDGDEIPAGGLMQPRVEVEVAFRMGADPGPDAPGFSAFVGALDSMSTALEIVDSAIADWKITFEDTVADNASSGLYVLGQRFRAADATDLELAGMVMRRNGEIASLGVGAACLGHPLRAAFWLARTMATRGRPLRAGDIILSGALGPMVPIAAGDHFEATIAGLGRVGARLSQETT